VLLCILGVLLLFAGIMLHSTRGMFIELRQALLMQMAQQQRGGHVEDGDAATLLLELGK
jgi:hypothetical protein